MPQRSRALMRSLATTVGTLLVVSMELLLLLGVYHHGDSVRSQRVAIAGLWGTVSVSDGADSATAVRRALPGLRRVKLPAEQVQTLSEAAQRLQQRPTDASKRALDNDLSAINSSGARRQHSMGEQAAEIYAAMLVIASVGWFIWFRRLVNRHRALQREVTAQQSLAESERRLLSLVQNSHDVIFVLDVDGSIRFVSPALEPTLGVRPEDCTGRTLLELVAEDDQPRLVQILATQAPGDSDPVSCRMVHQSMEQPLYVDGMVTNLLSDSAVNGVVLTVRDVTEQHNLRERLTRQAFYDSLTGLANRQLFTDRLQHALTARYGDTPSLAVLFCDLDDFKVVNDSYGHPAGDSLLSAVAVRLTEAIRPIDTAARFGGDEFAMLLEATSLEQAHVVAERVLVALAQPFPAEDGRQWRVSASIGISVGMPGLDGPDDVLRNADVAMYWAKDRGKSTIAVYESALHAAALDQLQLRGDLHRALRNDELVLHYQPTVTLADERITGFEALVRWQHPTRGLLPPSMFIGVAEDAGLIGALGSWVLTTACHVAVELQSDPRLPTMAVNVSAQQVADPGFVHEVREALGESGLPAEKLTLEITESLLLGDFDAVSAKLLEIRTLGVRIAIDDFGTGYSSLAYLNKLPVDVLKVDKTFVDRVATDPQSASVTQAVLEMGRAMQLQTIAEGVEQNVQADWLRDMRCDVGQGYLWSRPLPLPKVWELLASEPGPLPADEVAAASRTTGWASDGRAEAPVPQDR